MRFGRWVGGVDAESIQCLNHLKDPPLLGFAATQPAIADAFVAVRGVAPWREDAPPVHLPDSALDRDPRVPSISTDTSTPSKIYTFTHLYITSHLFFSPTACKDHLRF